MNFRKPVASLQISLFLVLLFQVNASAQIFNTDANGLNGVLICQAQDKKDVVVEDTKSTKTEEEPKAETANPEAKPKADPEANSEAIPADAEALTPSEGEEIISITDALKQGQLSHEKNLVDKFLLGIAILFLVIAFLLFNSLPPNSEESSTS